MPDDYLNLTDQEAAALGDRIPRPTPGPTADDGLTLLVLGVSVIMAMLLAFTMTAARHAWSPAADTGAPAVHASRNIEPSSRPPAQTVPEQPIQARAAAPPPRVAILPAAIPPRTAAPVSLQTQREPEPFPAPSVLALGWRCGYLVRGVYLYDAPVGRPVRRLEVNTQLYYSPYAQGCWRQILSRDGRVEGYACLYSAYEEAGVVFQNEAPRQTDAEATENPALTLKQLARIIDSLGARTQTTQEASDGSFSSQR